MPPALLILGLQETAGQLPQRIVGLLDLGDVFVSQHQTKNPPAVEPVHSDLKPGLLRFMARLVNKVEVFALAVHDGANAFQDLLLVRADAQLRRPRHKSAPSRRRRL